MIGGESARVEKISALMKSKSTQRKKKKKNSRRFSDEQIKSLESVFKMENKVEAKKKVEMATELGLHPRQVAIWFQNRRARWKSKQVEHDYSTLKADYDHLTHRFHSLNKEKHDLLLQLKNLCSQLKEGSKLDVEGNSMDMSGSSENGDRNMELKGNLSGPLEKDMTMLYSDEDDHKKLSSFNTDKEDEEEENLNINDAHVHGLSEEGLFGQPCSNWWDFWS